MNDTNKTTTTPTATACEQCFTNTLTQEQISNLLGQLGATSIADLCTKLVQGDHPQSSATFFINAVRLAQIPDTVNSDLYACLLYAGIHFTNG
jgi:hypothetical protein